MNSLRIYRQISLSEYFDSAKTRFLYTLPNTLGYLPKAKSCRQPTENEHEKH